MSCFLPVAFRARIFPRTLVVVVVGVGVGVGVEVGAGLAGG